MFYPFFNACFRSSTLRNGRLSFEQNLTFSFSFSRSLAPPSPCPSSSSSSQLPPSRRPSSQAARLPPSSSRIHSLASTAWPRVSSQPRHQRRTRRFTLSPRRSTQRSLVRARPRQAVAPPRSPRPRRSTARSLPRPWRSMPPSPGRAREFRQ